MNFLNLVAVGAGGFIGSIARYLAVISIDQKISGNFPYGTFAVNVVGSFLAGLVISFLSTTPTGSSTWRLFLVTGFCGGFTTFSAFAYENFSLINGNLSTMSAIYIALTLIVGVGAVLAGIAVGKWAI